LDRVLVQKIKPAVQSAGGVLLPESGAKVRPHSNDRRPHDRCVRMHVQKHKRNSCEPGPPFVGRTAAAKDEPADLR
jgi:hypothetical protein